MPNWCEQVLFINHKKKEKIESIKEAINKDQLLEFVFPQPTEWLSLEDCDNIEERKIKNIQTIGYPSIVDWQYSIRGTKWDIIDGSTNSIRKRNNKYYLKATYSTAWGPPYETYEELRKTHQYNIRLYYYEPLMDYAGKYENGINQQWVISEGKVPKEIISQFQNAEEEYISIMEIINNGD